MAIALTWHDLLLEAAVMLSTQTSPKLAKQLQDRISKKPLRYLTWHKKFETNVYPYAYHEQNTNERRAHRNVMSPKAQHCVPTWNFKAAFCLPVLKENVNLIWELARRAKVHNDKV